MENDPKRIKSEIERLLNRFGGEEICIDSGVIDALSLSELESVLDSLKIRAKSVNSDHLSWLIELADG